MGGTLGFAFLAGIVSILSPCVLPIVPLVLASALSQHRRGPAALAAGLALSFTVIGLFVATIGFAAGIGSDLVRQVGAAALVALGLAMLVPGFGAAFALAAAPASAWMQERGAALSGTGLGGQAAIGMLLGAVWSPCVGPTLGAASLLAARGENLAAVAATMAVFGIGAALPLLLLGLVSRETMLRWRGRLAGAGTAGRRALALLLMIAGGLILTGADKRLEIALLDAAPPWLLALTTRF